MLVIRLEMFDSSSLLFWLAVNFDIAAMAAITASKPITRAISMSKVPKPACLLLRCPKGAESASPMALLADSVETAVCGCFMEFPYCGY
ncbi:hypothetical protein D3C85_1415140 [compost metagenome]